MPYGEPPSGVFGPLGELFCVADRSARHSPNSTCFLCTMFRRRTGIAVAWNALGAGRAVCGLPAPGAPTWQVLATVGHQACSQARLIGVGARLGARFSISASRKETGEDWPGGVRTLESALCASSIGDC